MATHKSLCLFCRAFANMKTLVAGTLTLEAGENGAIRSNFTMLRATMRKYFKCLADIVWLFFQCGNWISIGFSLSNIVVELSTTESHVFRTHLSVFTSFLILRVQHIQSNYQKKSCGWDIWSPQCSGTARPCPFRRSSLTSCNNWEGRSSCWKRIVQRCHASCCSG